MGERRERRREGVKGIEGVEEEEQEGGGVRMRNKKSRECAVLRGRFSQ